MYVYAYTYIHTGIVLEIEPKSLLSKHSTTEPYFHPLYNW
jgi:hypothetical protein